MKQFRLLIVIFIFSLFQFQSCIISNEFKSIRPKNIVIDSLIGEFYTVRNKMKNKGYVISGNCDDPPSRQFFINKDFTFSMYAQARCATGFTIGTFGKWRIERNYIVFENFPIHNDTLIESKIINNNYITIKNTAGKFGYCIKYKNGLKTFKEFDDNGVYMVSKENVDSIIVNGLFPFYTTIYNKKGTDNYYKFRFEEPKSCWTFNFKLKIGDNYKLKGRLNDKFIVLVKKNQNDI